MKGLIFAKNEGTIMGNTIIVFGMGNNIELIIKEKDLGDVLNTILDLKNNTYISGSFGRGYGIYSTRFYVNVYGEGMAKGALYFKNNSIVTHVKDVQKFQEIFDDKPSYDAVVALYDPLDGWLTVNWEDVNK